MGATKVWTDDELMRLPDDGYKHELVDGALVVSPAGARHGRTIVRLTVRLGAFVAARGLGEVFDSSTGYRLPGGNLRVPDLSFVASARLPGGRAPVGFLYAPPDLAVEVLSPDDRPRLVADKVAEYLAVGVRLVWVIDPETARATAHRPNGGAREIPSSGTLDGGDVLPGFECRLADLFS
jgi:Uma2 family endonuclease